MGEQPSMVVRISGNIDALKKSLADGSAVIEGTTVKVREMAKPTDALHQSFQKFDSVLASVGINLGTEARALGEVSSAAGQTAGSLGGLTSAGLAVGAAFAGWNIGRKIAELFELDKAIADSTAAMMGWGDVGIQELLAGAETLGKASAIAGRNITDMKEAVRILTKEAEANAAALITSESRIAGWREEIAKVQAEGTWSLLTEDLKSHNFALTELSDRYRISVDAIEFFLNSEKKAAEAADAIAESNKRKMEALKASAAAQREAREQAERMAEATTHLKLAQGDYFSVLQQFDQQLVETVRHYMEMGLSLEDIATLTGESTHKIGLMTEALEAQSDAYASTRAQIVALEEAQRKACDEMVKNAQAAAKAQQDAFQKAVSEIIKSQQQMSAGGTMTYDLSTKAGMDYFKKMNPSAYISGDIPTGYFDTHTLQDAIRDGYIDLYAGYRTGSRAGIPPGFASGVTNFSGGPAIVGERGPELVTLPRGANVIPNHEIGAAIGGVTVVINGSVLSDERKIAAAISRSMESMLNRSGVRRSVRA